MRSVANLALIIFIITYQLPEKFLINGKKNVCSPLIGKNNLEACNNIKFSPRLPVRSLIILCGIFAVTMSNDYKSRN